MLQPTLKFSIIIPAHNEEQFIGTCLESIKRASKLLKDAVEVIVVLNRCTDNTETIALEYGAKIVRENSKNLSKIRNAGAQHALGEILVTIDADSWMSENMLVEIEKALQSKKYIGGGVPIKPDRYSAGIIVTMVVGKIVLKLLGLAGGLYWCYRRDFEHIGGFNEELILGEDMDFAKRLKLYGKQQQRRFITLPKVFLTTSMRKCDRFGDWYFFTSMVSYSKQMKEIMRGEYRDEHHQFINQYFYEFQKDKDHSKE